MNGKDKDTVLMRSIRWVIAVGISIHGLPQDMGCLERALASKDRKGEKKTGWRKTILHFSSNVTWKLLVFHVLVKDKDTHFNL